MAEWYWAVMLRMCIFVKLTSYFEGIHTYVCLLQRTLDPKSAPEGGGELGFNYCDALFLLEFSAYPCFLTILLLFRSVYFIFCERFRCYA